MARTLQTVIDSDVFSDVIVSTDDEEVAEVAVDCGASVPFRRPPGLSDDSTPTIPVVRHAIDMVSADALAFEAVCCVYPTAVLLTGADIVTSSVLVGKAEQEEAVVASVTRYSHPIQRALSSASDGLLEPMNLGASLERTQDLRPHWYDAGQFYWASPGRWQRASALLERVIPYEIPTWRVQDIDTEEDWKRAELIARLMAED